MIEFAGDSDMLTIGKLLRNERERQDMSIEDIADKTKIHPKYLKAIEDDRRDGFPGDLYCELFTRSYAEALGLEYARIKAGTFVPPSAPIETEKRPRRGEAAGDNRRRQVARLGSDTSRSDDEPDARLEKARVFSSAVHADEHGDAEDAGDSDASAKKGNFKKHFLIGAGVVLCLFVVVLYIVFASRTTHKQDQVPASGEGDTSVISALSDSLAPAAAGDSVATGDDAALDSLQSQSFAAAADSLDVTIVSADQSWARVVADGDTVFSSNLNPGIENQFRALERMVIFLVRWDSVDVFVFGHQLRPLQDFYEEGRRSVRLEITRDNWLSLIDSGRIGSE